MEVLEGRLSNAPPSPDPAPPPLPPGGTQNPGSHSPDSVPKEYIPESPAGPQSVPPAASPNCDIGKDVQSEPPLEQCMEQASLSSPDRSDGGASSQIFENGGGGGGGGGGGSGSGSGSSGIGGALNDAPSQPEEDSNVVPDIASDTTRDPSAEIDDAPMDDCPPHRYENERPIEDLETEQNPLSDPDQINYSDVRSEERRRPTEHPSDQQDMQTSSLEEGEDLRTASVHSPHLTNELQQRNILDTHPHSHPDALTESHLLQENHHHLQNPHHYQEHCHNMHEYQQHNLPKPPPSHLQEQQQHGGHLRENLMLEYESERMQQQQQQQHHHHQHHMIGDVRQHLEDSLSEHSRHQLPSSDRSHHGYWNLPLGMLSKVKSESKEWYDDDAMGGSDPALGGIKSESHDPYSNYRLHPGLGPESSHIASLNGPRPPSLPPHGGLPFSQSPDQRHQQHYQPYQSHPGMRDLSPMSPNFQSHPRQAHHPGGQHLVPQHSSVQHPGLQHSTGQHMHQQQQQYPGQQQQQYGGQPQLGMQGHPGQQYHQGLGPPPHMGPGMGHGHEGREGREGDPYSFIDEYTGPPPRPVEEILGQTQPKRRGRKPKHIKLMENGLAASICSGDPLAIAAAQAAHEAKKRKWRQIGPDGKALPAVVKPRKRLDRFDGVPEDELAKKTLPDHLGPNLDIVIISKFPFQIGINPGLFAAYKGHHYAGPGNHFWKCLFLSGLIPEPLTSDDDSQLLEHGIGFTNIVARTTRGSAELTRKEIKEGGQILLSKLQRYQPRVAVFNGKGIYEIFSGKKEFTFGRQPEKIEGTQTHVWVMPSSSARCAQLPRALDKVPFYTALRKFRDFLKGTLTELTEEEITFTSPKSKHYKNECDKLEGSLGDDITDSFLDDPLKEDLESSRFETDLDTDEIHRSITQSLYNLAGVTREQLETMDCPTIPIRKKRGRPKKTPEDPNMPSRPKPRPLPTDLMICNGEEPPRKKRGRPKKVLEDGTIPPPKRPGRKPKALKEMLAAQAMGQTNVHQSSHHQQMSINHLNGIMSPSGGYNSPPVGPPFSPHYGGAQNSVHSMSGAASHQSDRIPPMHSGLVHPLSNSSLHSGIGRSLPLPSMQSSGGGANGSVQQQSGCTTPNSNSSHGAMPPRGHTPQIYGQSPGYSPSPVSGTHPAISGYGSATDKTDLQLEDEHQLGLSPPPASPVMGQPDFEPPTNLPESEPPPSNVRSMPPNNQTDEIIGLLERQQHTPALQSQMSNPSTPADDSTTPYQSYPSYPGTKSCSPTYNTNVAPSPSYPPPVSQSPSYPQNVSCSPSYTAHNTQSPSYPPNQTHSPSFVQNISQSPSYPPNSTQSPSYPPSVSRSPSYPSNSTQSPSFNQATTQSPSYPTTNTHSPSYHSNINHSPSYSAITRSPSYPSSLTHSPSYPNSNNTQSPSYRPPTSQSPSFSSGSTHSPSLNKPLVPVVQSPQLTKGDVSSKSLSGLESLVDQIPSLSEAESIGGPHSAHSTSGGPCSNPTTPGPSNGPAAQFSPGPGGAQSFQSFPAASGGGFSHYGSPQSSHPYSPHYNSSSSTNLSTNFSVSSLANSSLTTTTTYSSGYDVEPTSYTTTKSSSSTPVSSSSGSSFSVSSLTGGSPTPTPNMYNSNNSSSSHSYSPAPSHSYSDIMGGSSVLPPTPPMSSSFMGSPGLMGSGSGMQSPMGSFHSSVNMSSSQLPYPYPQYGDTGPPSYSSSGHSTFPYPGASPGFHVPSPRFPYPSPYSGVPYSQSYSQNAMLERIKQTGMGMGFGGF